MRSIHLRVLLISHANFICDFIAAATRKLGIKIFHEFIQRPRFDVKWGNVTHARSRSIGNSPKLIKY